MTKFVLDMAQPLLEKEKTLITSIFLSFSTMFSNFIFEGRCNNGYLAKVKNFCLIVFILLDGSGGHMVLHVCYQQITLSVTLL